MRLPPARPDDRAIVLGGFIPARFGTAPDLAGAVPAVLTPLSATLLHTGVVHLALNMLMLGFCGRYVEAAIGSPALLLLYWSVLSETGYLDPRVLPAPWTAVSAVIELIRDGRLPADVAVSAGRALAETGLALGLSLSFSGVATFKGSTHLRDVARDVPLDRILVETDAPFLAPVPMRGKRNEPSFVTHTAAVLAEVKGVDPATFAEATSANVLRLFSKLPPLQASERAA